MTRNQLALLHSAKRALNLTDDAYRTVLRSVAGVESGKDLDNSSFERVMAVLERQGHRHRNGDHYWRNKVQRQAAACGDRMARFLEELITQTSYKLPGLCLRFSHDRTDQVAELTPAEAFQLAEMLKAVIARQSTDRPVARAARPCSQPSLFPTPDTPEQHSGDDRACDPPDGRRAGARNSKGDPVNNAPAPGPDYALTGTEDEEVPF